MAFSFENSKGDTYYLHSMEIKLKNTGKKQTIYYFGPKKGKYAIDEKPEGYRIITNRRTGLPFLKKK